MFIAAPIVGDLMTEYAVELSCYAIKRGLCPVTLAPAIECGAYGSMPLASNASRSLLATARGVGFLGGRLWGVEVPGLLPLVAVFRDGFLVGRDRTPLERGALERREIAVAPWATWLEWMS